MVCRYVKWYDKLFFVYRSQLYDEYYNPASLEELKTFLSYWSYDVLPQLAYTPEAFDCDDFAFLFKALMVKYTRKNCCFFVVGRLYKGGELLGGHAFNAVVAVGREVLFVEPQIGERLTAVDKRLRSPDGYEYEVLWILG
ncbi:MAG: lectin MOA-related protein [Acidilobaceae archaeon]